MRQEILEKAVKLQLGFIRQTKVVSDAKVHHMFHFCHSQGTAIYECKVREYL